ncbi:Nif3-like dinuclear metal center hexameric protein [Mediterraneibacter sp.]|jgi:dinuclear metal center YbgI/SA1388 family protein|uniref:Nif3-like dinuclear metal center hexameric protein n=1 Tax=Mediterraneibacter sp. TaxID=2316022 RepID=UPI0015AB73B9|nr:Nif3-like dinuclear metal center hexameric protein [Mediterraneibacter sp.]
MLCKEIIQVIEASYPKKAALDFDNVGLLAGRSEKEVNRVYLALDATEEVIERAVDLGADMLITHHPLIFSPMKQVTDEDFIGKRIVKLIQNDISYYAMHTNYDVLGMAKLAESILGIRETQVLDVTMEKDGEEEGIGRIGMLDQEMTLEECCLYVKHRLKLGSLKVYGDMERKVHCLAVSPGSGKSAVTPAIQKGADVLVTGDIGHHDGIDAVEQGLSVIDAGHYGTEYIFIDDMKHFLNEKLPVLDVMTIPIVHPFQVI